VIAVGVRDHGAIDGVPWVDVKVAGFAIQSPVGDSQHHERPIAYVTNPQSKASMAVACRHKQTIMSFDPHHVHLRNSPSPETANEIVPLTECGARCCGDSFQS
jgi:hypothetical protein